MVMAENQTSFHHVGDAYAGMNPRKNTAINTPAMSLSQQLDPHAERQVLWKIDLLLMPILTFSYGLQFVSVVVLECIITVLIIIALCEISTTSLYSAQLQFSACWTICISRHLYLGQTWYLPRGTLQREDSMYCRYLHSSYVVLSRTAAFYWGYIVGVLPIALLLQRFPVAKALSFLIFVRFCYCSGPKLN
jgi:hypothetical protein